MIVVRGVENAVMIAAILVARGAQNVVKVAAMQFKIALKHLFLFAHLLLFSLL